MSNKLQEIIKNEKTKVENQEGLLSYLLNVPGIKTTADTVPLVLSSCSKITTGTRRTEYFRHIDISALEKRKKYYEEISDILSADNNIDIIKDNIAYNINELRKLKNMTQEELAYAIDVERQYIGQLESGKRTPSLEVICKLATMLGVSVALFLATKYPFDIFVMTYYKAHEYQSTHCESEVADEDKTEFSEG